MKGTENRRWAISLSEVTVVAGIVALGMMVLVPALSQAREESRAAQCGANLARIGEAYGLWAADNGGFMPPRCRAVSSTCQLYTVDVGWLTKTSVKKEWVPYAGSYNHALRIVGNAPVRMDAPEPPTPGNSDHYISPDDRALNRYIIPNWQCGRRFDATCCPADVDTIKAPSQTVYPKGFPRNTVGSSFDIHGTSYATNIFEKLPWRGHGPWAQAVEAANNQQAGPNFNPQRIFSVGRYVVSLDFSPIHENWDEWLESSDVGAKAGVGAWHESSVVEPWTHSSVLFGDGHVSYGQFPIPEVRNTLSPLCDFVKAEWSLYPNRYVPVYVCP